MTITKHIERVLPNGDFIRAKVELREGHKTLSDGFSATADLWEKRGNRSGHSRYLAGQEMDCCGQMHKEILKYFPELAPVVAVHLASPEGVPMHAVANGWYYYSGAAEGQPYGPSGTPIEKAARSLHIAPEELPEGMTKEQFETFAEALRPRWAERAKVARELIESLD